MLGEWNAKATFSADPTQWDEDKKIPSPAKYLLTYFLMPTADLKYKYMYIMQSDINVKLHKR